MDLDQTNDGPPAEEAPAAAVAAEGSGVSAAVAAAAAASALEGASAKGHITCTVIHDGPPPGLGGEENANAAEEGNAPPAKRARTDDADAAMEEEAVAAVDDVRAAILAYKRKHGTTHDVLVPEGVSADAGNYQGDAPFGIRLASVRVRSAHSLLPYYYKMACGKNWRGRPPAPSDQAIVVEEVVAGAPEVTAEGVRRNDVLLFIDEKLVNITDKKRLKYYRGKIQNASKRPMKLTFFRPVEGEDDVEEEDEEEMAVLGNNEAMYVDGYEAPEKPVKLKSAGYSADERKARRAVLERRLEELEALQIETSAELGELRARDGIVDDEDDRPSIKLRGDEDFVIPSHINYRPPTKLRRKKMKPLNEACDAVENLLRQRMAVDMEAEKIRQSIKRSQMRLEVKENELKELDGRIPALVKPVKELEATIQDNWKDNYDKLKEYYEKNGHCNVMEKEDSKLAKWVTRQRTCYANSQADEPSNNMGTTKPYQVDLLNGIEFCWNPREQQFVQNVARLKQYRQEHGDANVPMKYEDNLLANFVQKWRREYRLFQEGKPSNMTPERLQILKEAGFSWRDPSRQRSRKDTRQESWEGFVEQLREFKSKYGHFMVNRQNKLLEKGDRLYRLDEFCGWVRKQYVLYEEGEPCQLTDEKVNQLKEMGFWFERGEAQRYTKSLSPKKGTVSQMDQLHVPKIDDGAGVPWHADSEGQAGEAEPEEEQQTTHAV